MSFTFDTLEYAKRLRDAKIPHEQAEAYAEALKMALGSGSGAVATKADLDHLEARLGARMDSLESRLLIKLGGLIIAIGGLVAAFLRMS